MFDEDLQIRQEIRRLSKQAKKYPLIFARLGDCYLKLGDPDHAEPILKKGIEEFPEYANAYLVLAEVHLYRGFYRDAEDCCVNGLQREPNHLGLLHLLMRIKKKMDDAAETEKIQSTLTSLDPLHSHEPESMAAAESSEDGIELSAVKLPRPAEIWKMKAATRLRRQRSVESNLAEKRGEAVPADEKTTALGRPVKIPEAEANPVSAGATNHGEAQGYLEQILGSGEAAEAIAESGTEAETDASPYRGGIVTRTLGELYVQQGKLEKAIEIYEKLLASDTSDESKRNRLRELKSLLEASAEKRGELQGLPKS